MPLNEATICATAKMYETRDTMRRLLGNNYPLRMQQWGTIIKSMARKNNESKLEAMMRLLKEDDIHDISRMSCIAAYVELVEMGHAD